MQGISINGIRAEYLSVRDRGLHYGDGLFETIACVNQQLQFWEQHLERMREGAARLKIQFPGEDIWLQDVQALLEAKPSSKACVIKLILTRGEGERGYRIPVKDKPNRIAIWSRWPENTGRDIEHGARLRICDTQLSMTPQLAGIKHLNRLENVLARSEWQDEYDEGLMTDAQGNIIEGTMSNVFAGKAGVLYTPSLEHSGINGIIRQQVLLIANEHGLDVREVDIRLADLASMDEIMLTNSVIGIRPVTEFNNKQYFPGDMTRLLTDQLSRKKQDYAQTLA